MKRRQEYKDEPIGRIEVVDDFLPPPEQLARRSEGVKVTISLSRSSVEFFKSHAARNKTSYQRMIRRLLDAYASHHSR